MNREIAATLMRGGTSKGVFVRLEDLPRAGGERDAFVLDLLGSPDPMQLDGLGGTHSSTSKLVAVSTPERARRAGVSSDATNDDSAIVYLFAQVGVAQASVDWRANCGNLTAAVAPFALFEGLIPATDPHTIVSLYNLNTAVRITADVPTVDGLPRLDGDFGIAGVPGEGARLDLTFHDLGGSGRELFPTGSRMEWLRVDGHELAVTVIEADNPVAITHASSFGLFGTEQPHALNSDGQLLAALEALRGEVACRLGLAESAASAPEASPAVPRVILLAPPSDHPVGGGTWIRAPECDVVARMTSMGVVHHAFPGHGLTACAVAAQIPGTVFDRFPTVAGTTLRLAHPKGVASVSAEVTDSPPTVRSVSIARTARRLFRGRAYLRPNAQWA